MSDLMENSLMADTLGIAILELLLLGRMQLFPLKRCESLLQPR